MAELLEGGAAVLKGVWLLESRQTSGIICEIIIISANNPRKQTLLRGKTGGKEFALFQRGRLMSKGQLPALSSFLA